MAWRDISGVLKEEVGMEKLVKSVYDRVVAGDGRKTAGMFKVSVAVGGREAED